MILEKKKRESYDENHQGYSHKCELIKGQEPYFHRRDV